MEIEEIKRTQQNIRNTFINSDREPEVIPEFGELIQQLPKQIVVDLEARVFGEEIRKLARKKKKNAGSIRAHLEKQNIYHESHQNFILAFEALCSVDLNWLERDLNKTVEILHLDEELLDAEMVSLKTVLETAGIPVNHEMYTKITLAVGEVYAALNKYHSDTLKTMSRKSFGSIVWSFQDKERSYLQRLSLLWACIASDNISHNLAAQYCRKEGHELDLFRGRPIIFQYKEKEELEMLAGILIREVTVYHGNVEKLKQDFLDLQSRAGDAEEMLREELTALNAEIAKQEKEGEAARAELERLKDKANRLNELEAERERLQGELEEAKRKEGEAYELADSCTDDLDKAKRRIAELEEQVQDANRWMAIQGLKDSSNGKELANPFLEMRLERKGYDLSLLCTIIGVVRESNGKKLTYDRIRALVYKAIDKNQGRMTKFRTHFSALENQGVFIKEEKSGEYDIINDPNIISDPDFRNILDSIRYAEEQQRVH